MTREDGIEMVMKYDSVRPSDTDVFLRAVDMTEDELLELVRPHRDPKIWAFADDIGWYTKDNVGNHVKDDGVEAVRIQAEKM